VTVPIRKIRLGYVDQQAPEELNEHRGSDPPDLPSVNLDTGLPMWGVR
jgi:hypothetical protein